MMGNGEDLKENAKEKLYKYLCLLKLSSPFYNNIDSYINAILRTANISSLLCTLAIKAVRRFFIFLALLHFLSFCHHPPPKKLLCYTLVEAGQVGSVLLSTGLVDINSFKCIGDILFFKTKATTKK